MTDELLKAQKEVRFLKSCIRIQAARAVKAAVEVVLAMPEVKGDDVLFKTLTDAREGVNDWLAGETYAEDWAGTPDIVE